MDGRLRTERVISQQIFHSLATNSDFHHFTFLPPRVLFIDERGAYIGEEYTLALATKFIFHGKRGPAAANLSTSRMIDDLARAAGAGPVYRTPVGEAHVARAVIDKGCIIPDGMTIGHDPEKDLGRFHVTRSGVVLVTPDMLGQPLHTGD